MKKKEEKAEKVDGCTIVFPEGKSAVVHMPVGGIPYNIWKEWEDDCKKNYSGVRWAKLWNDHLHNKMMENEIKV